MDEMTAFERHLSAELGEMAGPGRHIDGMAMVSAVSTQSPRRTFRVMFSATRFVVAGAVVAIFGGFLLAGMPSRPPAEVQAPAASAPASDPPRLVYMLDGDVYVAEEDGANPVRIVDGDADAECGVRWGNLGIVSPDGRHIAYRSRWNDDCPGTVSIFDMDGRSIASVPGVGWQIAWAPDNTRFATWLSLGESIGVYGIDGSLQAELDASSMELGGDYDPRWTPDGTALLVPLTDGPVVHGPALVARLPLDGGELEMLPATDPLSIRSATFSPDGTSIAYVRPDGKVVVAALNGPPPGVESYVELGDPVDAWWGGGLPLWSPNGDRLAVATHRYSTDGASNSVAQSASLWILDPTTMLATVVANVEGESHLEPIAFSPDSGRVLVQRSDGDQGDGAAWVRSLWSVASDGSGSTLIVEGADVGMWVPSSHTGDGPAGP